MSDIERIKKAWATLNEYEAESARKNEIREGNLVDFKDPVLDSLNSTGYMVQTMTGRLDRVEQRLNILYWIGLEILKFKNGIDTAILWGIGCGVAVLVIQAATKFF